MPPAWRNRILEYRLLRPYELEPHPLQWRVHPDYQRAAMRGVLEQVGIAGVGLAYVSPESGNLRSIDGHMRVSLGDVPWPHAILDVDDEEAALLLATHDPLAALALAGQDELGLLLHEVQTQDAAVQQMLLELGQQHGLYLEAPPTLESLEQQYGSPDDNPEAFWKTISLKVPPETWDRYTQLMASLAGADEAARFAVLLEQAGG